MNEKNTFTTATCSQKHATLRQLNFERTYVSSDLEEKIADYERKFKYTNHHEDPITWYYLQMELEKLYKLKMHRVKLHPGEFTVRPP